jgi:hypothetical protein
MVSYVTLEQRLGLVEAIVHLVNRDFVALAELYKQLGFIPQGEPVEPIAEALNNALPDALDSPVSELNLKSVFSKLGNVMFEFPFALPPFYTAVIRCLGVLEVSDGTRAMQGEQADATGHACHSECACCVPFWVCMPFQASVPPFQVCMPFQPAFHCPQWSHGAH